MATTSASVTGAAAAAGPAAAISASAAIAARAALRTARLQRRPREQAVEHQVDVGVEEALEIERLLDAGADRVLPGGGEQQREVDHPQRVGHVDLAEFAARDAALQRPGQELAAARHDLLVVEARQLGKVRRLGHDELGKARDARLADRPPPLADELDQQLAAATPVALEHLLPALEQGQQGAANNGLEKRLLAVEIKVHGALRDPRPAGHLLELGGGVPALHEQ